MSDIPTISELASEAHGWFTTTTRADETIDVLRDGAPEWITDAVRDAHAGMFPDDRIYTLCRDAFDFIADGGDDASDFADGAVDVYTSDRVRWLASHLGRVSLCDEAASDFAIGDGGAGIIDRIGWGQFLEASRVYATVWEACERADD